MPALNGAQKLLATLGHELRVPTADGVLRPLLLMTLHRSPCFAATPLVHSPAAVSAAGDRWLCSLWRWPGVPCAQLPQFAMTFLSQSDLGQTWGRCIVLVIKSSYVYSSKFTSAVPHVMLGTLLFS